MPSSKDPEVNRQKANEYRLAHPDWHRKANREWAAKKWATDPEYRAKRLEQKQRAWAAKTPEERAELAAHQKEWFARHQGYNRQKQAEGYASYPVRAMVWSAKTRAAKSGVPFDLDWRLIEMPDICPVLGVPLRQAKKGEPRRGSPSLDRLIPSLGYVQSNVRVISHEANQIKQDFTLEYLRERADRLRGQLSGVELVIAYLERETA